MGLPGGLLELPWACWEPPETSWRPPGASRNFFDRPQKITNVSGNLLKNAQNPFFYGFLWPLLTARWLHGTRDAGAHKTGGREDVRRGAANLNPSLPS